MMNWNNNRTDQKKTHKYFTVGAGWFQEQGNPKFRISFPALRLALLALRESGEGEDQFYMYCFDNNRKESDRHPDFNLALRIPIEHYPIQEKRQSNGWNNQTGASKQRQQREQLANQQEQRHRQKKQDPYRYFSEDDTDVPF